MHPKTFLYHANNTRLARRTASVTPNYPQAHMAPPAKVFRQTPVFMFRVHIDKTRVFHHKIRVPAQYVVDTGAV